MSKIKSHVNQCILILVIFYYIKLKHIFKDILNFFNFILNTKFIKNLIKSENYFFLKKYKFFKTIIFTVTIIKIFLKRLKYLKNKKKQIKEKLKSTFLQKLNSKKLKKKKKNIFIKNFFIKKNSTQLKIEQLKKKFFSIKLFFFFKKKQLFTNFFFRKNKIYLKNKFSRNRLVNKNIVLFALAINILFIVELHSLYYDITINYTYLNYLFLFLIFSIAIKYFVQYKLYTFNLINRQLIAFINFLKNSTFAEEIREVLVICYLVRVVYFSKYNHSRLKILWNRLIYWLKTKIIDSIIRVDKFFDLDKKLINLCLNIWFKKFPIKQKLKEKLNLWFRRK